MPRVMICEDSATYAAALRRTLEHDGQIVVAAVCGSAEEAIEALPRVQPDLVTMDIELPGIDGFAAVEQIMSRWPVPILVLSSHVGPASGHAAAALAAGALEALAKDGLDLHDPSGPMAAALRHRVTMLARARVIRHPRARLAGWQEKPAFPLPAQAASVVGIGASTGGPPVLARVLAALPADYPVPVLVVQHMSAGFTEGLAVWLDQSVAVPVALATDGGTAKPGVWIAPEGAHLTVDSSGRFRLDRDTVAGPHRPSADVLFTSIAQAAGGGGVAIVLSGMGRDGAAGAAAVLRAGGVAIAQEENSCAVFGMPRAAMEQGVTAVLSPAQIAAWLRGLWAQPLKGMP
jgi:two-component system chemotaxis response regulator CheB